MRKMLSVKDERIFLFFNRQRIYLIEFEFVDLVESIFNCVGAFTVVPEHFTSGAVVFQRYDQLEVVLPTATFLCKKIEREFDDIMTSAMKSGTDLSMVFRAGF